MRSPRIGSLFSGYGGLDLGVQQVFGGEVQWHVEFDAAPSKILAHHWPDVPNYGDVGSVDWASVPPVDILAGGFPCQDVSLAGRRAGLTNGTRSGLWSEYARAIDIVRPEMVVIENVRGLLSAEAAGAVEPDPWGMGDGSTRPTLNAFGVVLGDLAGLGYDARWVGLRAADAGAPHGRFRVFVLAHPQGSRFSGGGPRGGSSSDGEVFDFVSRHASAGGSVEDTDVAARGERGQSASGEMEGRRTRPHSGGRSGASATSANSDRERWDRRSEEHLRTGGFSSEDGTSGIRATAPRDRAALAESWGPYAPAIERWERASGRIAPTPTRGDGKAGAQRLSPVFVEWMMGLPEGHVTDPAIGLTRNEQLKALGNGVVPQQAALALRLLMKPVAGLQVAA